MKTTGKILAGAIVLLSHTTFATQPSKSEQSQDFVRVVVVSVGRTSLPAVQAGASTQSLPGLKVVYVVEALGSEPVENRELGRIGITVDGDAVRRSKESKDETLIVLSKYTEYNWNSLQKPRVSNPERAAVYDFSIPYFELPKGKTDLHIEAGFNLSTRSFVFDDITVD